MVRSVAFSADQLPSKPIMLRGLLLAALKATSACESQDLLHDAVEKRTKNDQCLLHTA